MSNSWSYCEFNEKYGWNITELNEESLELVEDFIDKHKNDFWYMKEPEKQKPKKTQFKYVCESCDLTVHAKVEKSIVCGECGCELKIEEVEDDAS